jgi:hypothetical protein
MMSSRLEKKLPYNEIFYPAIGLFFCHNKWVEINCCFIMSLS